MKQPTVKKALETIYEVCTDHNYILQDYKDFAKWIAKEYNEECDGPFERFVLNMLGENAICVG